MTGSIGPEEFGSVHSPALGTPCENTGGIIYTSQSMKRFEGGEVRLSGAVNLSKLESDGQITFSCLFVTKQAD